MLALISNKTLCQAAAKSEKVGFFGTAKLITHGKTTLYI